MRTNSVRIHSRKLSTIFTEEFWWMLNSFRCAQIQKGFMRKKCPQIGVKVSAELWLALDAHKFSKDSCAKIVYKFQLANSTSFSKFREIIIPRIVHQNMFKKRETLWRSPNVCEISNRYHQQFWRIFTKFLRLEQC